MNPVYQVQALRYQVLGLKNHEIGLKIMISFYNKYCVLIICLVVCVPLWLMFSPFMYNHEH